MTFQRAQGPLTAEPVYCSWCGVPMTHLDRRRVDGVYDVFDGTCLTPAIVEPVIECRTTPHDSWVFRDRVWVRLS